jgi:hypothetical protein
MKKFTEDDFNCPIGLELMTDPVKTPYGHYFERSNIVGWLAKNSTCPLSRQALKADQLVDATELKSAIQAAHPELFPQANNNNLPRVPQPAVQPSPAAPAPSQSAQQRPAQQIPAQPRPAEPAPKYRVTPELLAARQWYKDSRQRLQNDPDGTYARLRLGMQADEANGTYGRMRREMQEDPNGTFAGLRARMAADQANGTYDRMRREMHEDRNGVFAKMREDLNNSTMSDDAFATKFGQFKF